MAYVLQADQLSEDRAEVVKMIAGCGADLVVLDPFHQSWEFETGRWTAGEIAKIRGASPGRKVVAYISIGEAENYRQYWKKEWDPDEDGKPDQGAPDFLEKVNPDWWGNYKVRYWSKDWRKIVLDEIAQIMKQDFDGLYLDIVDAFEYFEYDPKTDSYLDRKKNKETKNSYREDMVELVQAIADLARTGKKDFLIIPQNAVQLLDIRDYLKIIDAVGVEDLFTEGEKSQDAENIKYRIAFLDRMKKAKKPVLLIEYCKERRLQDRVMREAAENGFVLLITDRELKSLRSIKPLEKPVEQPKPDEGNSDGRKPEEGTEEKDDAGTKEVEMKEDEKEEKEEKADPFASIPADGRISLAKEGDTKYRRFRLGRRPLNKSKIPIPTDIG
jgi:cysteinyl-tRNA synthetase